LTENQEDQQEIEPRKLRDKLRGGGRILLLRYNGYQSKSVLGLQKVLCLTCPKKSKPSEITKLNHGTQNSASVRMIGLQGKGKLAFNLSIKCLWMVSFS
jgi:hypothetical protein